VTTRQNGAGSSFLNNLCAKDTQQAIDHPPISLPDKILPHVRDIPAWSPTTDVGEQLEFSIQFMVCQVKDDPKLWNENRCLHVAKV